MSQQVSFAFVLILLVAVSANNFGVEQVVKSRQIEECSRRLRVVMRFECRLLPDNFCLPYAYDMEFTPFTGKELLEQKCCAKRCSLRTLRTLCCFQ